MSTYSALNRLRATRVNYFRQFIKMAEKLYRQSPFFGDPHAFTYVVPPNAPKEAEYLKKAAVMQANLYPGKIWDVDASPGFGQYKSSAFIQRVQIGQEEFLKLKRGADETPFAKKLVKETIERILAGEVMWEHMVGGQAKRMKIDTEKFVLTPADLIKRYKVFYKEMAEECRRSDKTLTLPDPSSLPLPSKLDIEDSNRFGVRHMLAFAYSIKKLAEAAGVNWQEALSKQSVFLIANEKIMPKMLELFSSFGFFGLNPDKVFFMETQNYDVLTLSDEGNFVRLQATDYIHNHGAARLETTEENKWFTYRGGVRKPQPGEDIREVYAKHANLQSLNIEDLKYLTNAINVNTLTIALNAGKILGTEDRFDMMMDVVGQKLVNPQKGGVLALDFDYFGKRDGRLVMIEAFQAYPRFFHYVDAVADRLYADIKWLNLNKNNYPTPVRLYEMARDEGLPVWLELKGNGLRNESPQGDANYFLPTLFVARTERIGGVDHPLSIVNLKDAVDIPNGLTYMSRQENLPGFGRMVRDFRTTGMLLENYSFAQISRPFKDAPIDINTILAHPYLTERMDTNQRDHLASLGAVFQVEGSLVYNARIKDDKVYIKVADGTRRGTGDQYNSRAAEEVAAEDVKSRVFKEGRVWSGFKSDGNYSYILVSNLEPGADEGELVLLLGKYDESIPDKKKPVIHAKKLEKVIEYARENDINEAGIAKMRQAFQKLSWQYLFENGATTIMTQLIKELKPA